MKSVYQAIGITGLCVAAALGQGSKPSDGKPAAGSPPPSAPVVATSGVARVTNTLAAVAGVIPVPVVKTPVIAPPAVVPAVVTQAVVAVVPEVASQAVARVEAPFVVTPFSAKYTARTAPGISNALVRWGVWAHGEKPIDATASEEAVVVEMQFPTERAVLAALNWLQREQNANGCWKGNKEIVTPTLTSLALLAYLGHGETPAATLYGPTIRKAITWLVSDQEAGGRFKGRDNRDYTQPIAALALAEYYGMTLDPDVKLAAEKAIALIIKGQHENGGFGYNLDKAAGDATSYMSWCAQALAAARMAKLEVPGLDRAIEKAAFAICQNADPAGGFGETGPGRTSLSGAAVAGLQYLGAPHVPEALKTLDFLTANTFSYASDEARPYPGAGHLYAAWNLTQAKYQAGADAFRAWNKSLARELVGNQARERNLLTKWVDLGRWERHAASESKEAVIQDTCFGALMLEVYYRYLPLGK